MPDKLPIITITGDLGSGKSTVAKLIAGKLHYQRYSTGDFQRTLAKAQGLTSLELNRLAETNPELDARIDAGVVELTANQTNLVIDSRLAWHFAPGAFKVYLTVDPLVAAARILAAPRGEVEQYSSLEEASDKLSQRRASEAQRFQTFYQLDLTNFRHYDVLVDTTFPEPQIVADKIVVLYRSWWESQLGAGVWLNPRRLLPIHTGNSSTGEECTTAEPAVTTSGEQGDAPIAILIVGGYFYIYHGRRRVSAAISAGQPFCPGEIIAVDDEYVSDDLSAQAYIREYYRKSTIAAWETEHFFTFPSLPSELSVTSNQ